MALSHKKRLEIPSLFFEKKSFLRFFFSKVNWRIFFWPLGIHQKDHLSKNTNRKMRQGQAPRETRNF